MQPNFELVSLSNGDIWAHNTFPYWIRPNEFDGFFYCYISIVALKKTKKPWFVDNKRVGKYTTLHEAMNNVPQQKNT
jgi:hypothetical protein